MAHALGLAPALHPRSIRRPARLPVPRARVVLPDEGRDGGLPGDLRRAVRPAVRTGSHVQTSRAGGRSVRRHDRERSDRGGQRRRGDRGASGSAQARVRERARPIDRAAALERVPPAVAAPGRRRPARRRRELGGRYRVRGRRGHTRPGSPARRRGSIPVRIERSGKYGFVIFRFIGHHVLTLGTPIGRKIRPKFSSKGDPLIRVKPKDLPRRRRARRPGGGGAGGHSRSSRTGGCSRSRT